MPDIQANFAAQFPDLNIIAIDPDSDDYNDLGAVAAFVANQGVDYPVTVQETAVTPTYSTIEGIYDGANPYPVDILIDKNGVMRYIAREYDPTALADLIPVLLAE